MKNTRAMYKVLGLHFSSWMWIFWPLRFVMRIRENPEGLTGDKLAAAHGGAEPIYVLPRFTLVDVFVLRLWLRRSKLPRPRVEAAPKRFRQAGLLSVRIRKGLINPNDPREAFTDQVAALLKHDPRSKSGKLVLQPVTVFFTRTPARTERNFVLRSLFPDDENANTLQKLVFLLLHGGVVRLHFGPVTAFSREALEAQDAAEQQGPGEETAWARRIRRQLLIDFARERTSVLGPPVYDVDVVANWILRTPETRRLMDAEPKPAKAQRRALGYLEEIAASYNYTTVRALEKVFDFLWTRIFKGVRVRNFEAVAEVAKQGQLIWMPCHRSHLDYMLLSYVLFKKGLVTPHIWAGINLAFWPAGPVLRRGGAFFARRSFQGNKLYAHVMSQYIDFLMHNSFPVEFFHEGGRSRIGKLLTPKTGVLSMCVASILKRSAAQTYIIPVYFGYDKVMEDGSYAAELSGAKKQNESVWQLLRSLRYLFSNYGRVDVSFGAPVHFGDAWGEYYSKLANPELPSTLPTQLADVPGDVDSRDPRVQLFVRALARRVNQGINSTAIASGSAILTSVLLSQAEASVPRATLTERVKLLHTVVGRLGSYLGWSVSTSTVGEGEVLVADTALEPPADASARVRNATAPSVVNLPMPAQASLDAIVEEIVSTGLQWEFMVEGTASAEPLLTKNPAKDMNLWWYRGTIFHVLAIPGLVASFLMEAPEGEDVRLGRLEAKLAAVRAVWDEELWWPDSTSTASLVTTALRVFSELGLVSHEGEAVRVAAGPGLRETLRFFCDLVRPERELYALQIAVGVVLMQTRGRFSREDVMRKSQEAHRSAFLRGVANHPANLSRVFAGRTFDSLFRAGVFVPREKQLLTVAYTEVASVSDFFELNTWREFVEPG